MQTLIPQPVTAQAHPTGRRVGRALGFGLTPRTLLLLAGATLLCIPAFVRGHTPWLMFVADALLLVATLADAIGLPAPERFVVTRTFVRTPELGHAVRVELTVTKSADGLHAIRLTDDLHPSLQRSTPSVKIVSYANEPLTAFYDATPTQRGDVAVGRVYVRYRSIFGFAERWASADAECTVRVYAAGEQAADSASIYLLRARQIEAEKRRLRRLGMGREFESMREYQPGDELRNISWTATARQNRLITRQYTTERSQQVWIVLDAGRLSRTAFEVGPLAMDSPAEDGLRLVTQLDQAAFAAGLLARVVQQSGDKCALLTYGRNVQQQVLPGGGAAHLRQVLDALSQVRSETAEADHLLASGRLRHLQRRRGLMLWITEMTESAGRPEILAAVTGLVRRHVVVLILLQHPELESLAGAAPPDARGMFAGAAAQEMLERRRLTLAQLRAQGVLVVETSASQVAADAVSKYLEVKAEGRL